MLQKFKIAAAAWVSLEPFGPGHDQLDIGWLTADEQHNLSSIHQLLCAVALLLGGQAFCRLRHVHKDFASAPIRVIHPALVQQDGPASLLQPSTEAF